MNRTNSHKDRSADTLEWRTDTTGRVVLATRQYDQVTMWDWLVSVVCTARVTLQPGYFAKSFCGVIAHFRIVIISMHYSNMQITPRNPGRLCNHKPMLSYNITHTRLSNLFKVQLDVQQTADCRRQCQKLKCHLRLRSGMFYSKARGEMTLIS